MKVFLNDRIIDERQAFVSIFDHGFLYGDGLYETVSARGYRVRFWSEHARRLKQGLKTIGLSCPWTMDHLECAIIRMLRANRRPDASARITISRGAGPLGLDPTACPTPTLAILLHPERPIDLWRHQGVSLAVSKVLHESLLSTTLKSINMLSAIVSKTEAQQSNAFEGLRLNAEGHLTEGTTTNLFFIRRGRLCTPSVACGILEGITRRRILRLARRWRWPTTQGAYTVQDLKRADEVFLTNSTFEVLPVVTLVFQNKRLRVGDGKPGPCTVRLQHGLK